MKLKILELYKLKGFQGKSLEPFVIEKTQGWFIIYIMEDISSLLFELKFV